MEHSGPAAAAHPAPQQSDRLLIAAATLAALLIAGTVVLYRRTPRRGAADALKQPAASASSSSQHRSASASTTPTPTGAHASKGKGRDPASSKSRQRGAKSTASSPSLAGMFPSTPTSPLPPDQDLGDESQGGSDGGGGLDKGTGTSGSGAPRTKDRRRRGKDPLKALLKGRRRVPPGWDAILDDRSEREGEKGTEKEDTVKGKEKERERSEGETSSMPASSVKSKSKSKSASTATETEATEVSPPKTDSTLAAQHDGRENVNGNTTTKVADEGQLGSETRLPQSGYNSTEDPWSWDGAGPLNATTTTKITPNPILSSTTQDDAADAAPISFASAVGTSGNQDLEAEQNAEEEEQSVFEFPSLNNPVVGSGTTQDDSAPSTSFSDPSSVPSTTNANNYTTTAIPRRQPPRRQTSTASLVSSGSRRNTPPPPNAQAHAHTYIHSPPRAPSAASTTSGASSSLGGTGAVGAGGGPASGGGGSSGSGPTMPLQTQLASVRGALEAARIREEKYRAELESARWEGARMRRVEGDLHAQIRHLTHQIQGYAAILANVAPQLQLQQQAQLQLQMQAVSPQQRQAFLIQQQLQQSPQLHAQQGASPASSSSIQARPVGSEGYAGGSGASGSSSVNNAEVGTSVPSTPLRPDATLAEGVVEETPTGVETEVLDASETVAPLAEESGATPESSTTAPPPPPPLPIQMNGIGSPLGMMSPVLAAPPPMGMMSPILGGGMSPMGMGAYSVPHTPTYFPYSMSSPPPPQPQHPFLFAQQMHFMQQQQQFHLQQQRQQHPHHQPHYAHPHQHAPLASPQQGAPSAHQASAFAMPFPPAPPPPHSVGGGVGTYGSPIGAFEVSAPASVAGTSSAGSLSPDLTGSSNPGITRNGKRKARGLRPTQGKMAAVGATTNWEEVSDGWIGARTGLENRVIAEGDDGGDEEERLLSGNADEDDDAGSEHGYDELLVDAILKRPSSLRVRTRSKRTKINMDDPNASGSSGSGSNSAKEVPEGPFTEFTFPSLSHSNNVYYRTSRSGSSAASPSTSYLVPAAAEVVVEMEPIVVDEEIAVAVAEEDLQQDVPVTPEEQAVNNDDAPSPLPQEGEDSVFAVYIPASVSDPVLPLRKGLSEAATAPAEVLPDAGDGDSELGTLLVDQ